MPGLISPQPKRTADCDRFPRKREKVSDIRRHTTTVEVEVDRPSWPGRTRRNPLEGLGRGSRVFVSLAGHFADDEGADQDLYSEATVVRMRLGVGEVVVRLVGSAEYTGEHTFASSAVFPANPTNTAGTDDLARMSHLNEPSVLSTLHTRYDDDDIYTKAGNVLIAVNPFKPMDALYADERAQLYTEAQQQRTRIERRRGGSNDDAAAARLRGRRGGVPRDAIQGERSGARRRRRIRRG